MDLTSMVCEKKKLHDKNGFFDEKNTSTTEFWNFLGDMRENKSLMGCSASGATEREIQIDGERTGILTGHAYGLLDVIDLHCEKEDKIKKLLRVRNPWGKCEWNGPWSDYSEEIEQYKEDLDKWMSQLAEDERFNLQEEDGTFLIDYKNFRDIYNKLFVAIDFPDEWCGLRFESQWTKETCGGLPLKNTEAEKLRFANNPQYLVAPTEDTEMFISFTQPDGRVRDTDGSYSTFPYKDRIHMAMLLVMKLDENEDIIETYEKSKVKYMEKPAVLHELSLRMKMKAGEKWVIVLSPKMHGLEGRYELSLYVNCKLFSIDIRRLNGPREQYSFIAEEYEKNVNKLPHWKEDLCR
jgi:calpain, invertebrate